MGPLWVSLVEIGSVVLPNGSPQTDRHTDRQPLLSGPERTQYIQSMEITECKKLSKKQLSENTNEQLNILPRKMSHQQLSHEKSAFNI